MNTYRMSAEKATGNDTESREEICKSGWVSRSKLESVVFDENGEIADPRFRTKSQGGCFEYFWPNDLRLSPREITEVKESGLETTTYAVTEEEGLIVGLAELERIQGDDIKYRINFVSVDPEYQNRGHGRKLVAEIFDLAQKDSIELIITDRSEMGEERLDHIFQDLAEQTGVKISGSFV